MENDFFNRMTKEAMDELASGNQGWREAETNTLILACFGVLTNHLAHMLVKPLWFFACTVAAGVIWFIVGGIIGTH